MTAINVIGIIILALNLAGVCFMVIMLFVHLRQGIKKRRMAAVKARGLKGASKRDKRNAIRPMPFNKADYLLDDLDLSEFDGLDIDDDNGE